MILLPVQSYIHAQAASWEPANGPYGGTILEIAASPDGILYASVFGGGIYRSTDDGRHWTLLRNSLTKLEGTEIFFPEWDLLNLSASEMVVNDKGHVFATTFEGVGIFRSKDHGENWTAVNPGLEDLVITDLEAGSDEVLFAATYNRGVYRSVDAGTFWSLLGLTDTRVYDLVALNDSTLLAGTEYGIYKWSLDKPGWEQFSASFSLSDVTDIEVSGPFVFAIAENRELYVFTKELGIPIQGAAPLYVSQNGLYELTAVGAPGDVAVSIPENGIHVFSRTDGFAWVRSLLAFEGKMASILFSGPDGRLISDVLDEGLYFSFNLGKSWELRNEGIQARLIHGLFSLQNDQLVVGTGQWLFLKDQEKEGWKKLGPFEGPVTRLLQTSEDLLFAVISSVGLFRSEDEGLTWRPVSSEVIGTEIRMLTTREDGQLYVASEEGVFRSLDNLGKYWEPVGDFSASGAQSVTITREGTLLVLASEIVFVSVDDGHSWTQAALPSPERVLGELMVNEEDHLFLQLDGLWRSADQGKSWERLGFEDYLISDIEFGPRGRVFLSSFAKFGDYEEWYYDNRVFVSEDAGQNWTMLPDDLSHAMIMDLQFTEDKRLYAATYGSGLYFLETGSPTAVSSLGPAAGFRLEQNYPNPFDNWTTIEFELSEKSEVLLFISDAQGKRVATLISGQLDSGIHQVDWQPQEHANGFRLYTLIVDGATLTKKMLYLGEQ